MGELKGRIKAEVQVPSSLAARVAKRWVATVWPTQGNIAFDFAIGALWLGDARLTWSSEDTEQDFLVKAGQADGPDRS